MTGRLVAPHLCPCHPLPLTPPALLVHLSLSSLHYISASILSLPLLTTPSCLLFYVSFIVPSFLSTPCIPVSSPSISNPLPVNFVLPFFFSTLLTVFPLPRSLSCSHPPLIHSLSTPPQNVTSGQLYHFFVLLSLTFCHLASPDTSNTALQPSSQTPPAFFLLS